jgi:hypothetical protein
MPGLTRTQSRPSASSSTNQIKMQYDVQIRVQICQSNHNKTGAMGFFTKAYTPCYRTFIASFFILELLVLKINVTNAVPDLAPALLDSKFLKPANLQLLF